MINTIRLVLKVAKPFLQVALFTLAFWISLTRISDYFHHPTDVVTGSMVGIIFATAIVHVSSLPSKLWSLHKSEDDEVNTADIGVKLLKDQKHTNVREVNSQPKI